MKPKIYSHSVEFSVPTDLGVADYIKKSMDQAFDRLEKSLFMSTHAYMMLNELQEYSLFYHNILAHENEHVWFRHKTEHVALSLMLDLRL